MEANTKTVDDIKTPESFGATRNIVAWILLGLFCISWVLPIYDGSSKGVFGAWLAYEGLLEGIASFIGSDFMGRSPAGEGGLLGSLILIYLGLPNVLFVVGFIFFMLRSGLSCILFSLSLPAVAYWVFSGTYSVSIFANSGMYLWALTFFGMFILASKEYMSRKRTPYAKFFISWESLSIYVPGVMVFAGNMLFS